LDISAWLRELGLERYEQAFLDNDIDPAVLPDVTADDLIGLGVTSIGHRRKILAAISRLQVAQAIAPSTRMPDPAPEPSGDQPSRRPEAERRQLTVMFVDLVGSTALSAQLDPEDMREVIRVYQNAVAGEISRVEGHVAKFMGDGVLAYFGWPRTHEDEAERAVRAGLALVQTVGQLKTPAGETLAARVGIATGLVVVGDLIGEGASQEQAVVGDTPNLAARLQGIAAPAQVVVAEATRRLLGSGFEFKDLGKRRLKGICEPVTAFAVIAERATESRFEARAGPSLLPMVGRDQELALLLERWAQTETGEGQGVLLIGEAGIGKSRIARALLDALVGEQHIRIRYQCSPYHTDSALWPVIQHLIYAAGIATADPTDTKLDKLETLLERSGGRTAAPLIAELIGVDGAARYDKLDLTPQAQRRRTLEALVEQIVGLAARKTVLMVLEDAHWIDPTTLELIEQWLDPIAAVRVLLLITSRPDQQPQLAAHPHVTRLTLNRLGRSGIEAIVARLGGEHLPSATISEIIARTDGVPLFVEELTKAVLETGEASIPASLHDSLMARLDRIPEVKEVAQVAACIGREFDYALLAAVMDRSEPDLCTALDKLAAAELIFRRGAPPARHYVFKHALVRDAAYESLLRTTRQTVHAAIARSFEANFPETVASEPELLAHHHARAGAFNDAIEYWRRAAERAIERSASRDAVEHLTRGLETLARLPDDARRVELEAALQVRLGAAYTAAKGQAAPEVETAYLRARSLCQASGNEHQLFVVLRGLWLCYQVGSKLDAAHRIGEDLLEIAQSQENTVYLVEAHRALGQTALWSGRFAESWDYFGRGLALYDPQAHGQNAYRFGQDPRVISSCMAATARWILGYPDQARRGMRQSLDWAEELNHPYSRSVAGIVSTFFYTLLGDLMETRSAAERTIQAADAGHVPCARLDVRPPRPQRGARG
jgi:class 3 adenylate cyclase/tetratricopeptide (TPR) repeat protein